MLPDIHIGRDAPVAVALTLQALAGFNGPISELKKVQRRETNGLEKCKEF